MSNTQVKKLSVGDKVRMSITMDSKTIEVDLPVDEIDPIGGGEAWFEFQGNPFSEHIDDIVYVNGSWRIVQ